MTMINPRPLMLAAVAAAALAWTGSGWPAAAKTVNGTVGPGFTIGVTMEGKKVARLKAGVAYRFVISDRSSSHNFRLTGPRFNRELTGVGFTGKKSFLLKLRKGTYRFVCDPHADFMRGRFLVS
jgi:plastocyanin